MYFTAFNCFYLNTSLDIFPLEILLTLISFISFSLFADGSFLRTLASSLIDFNELSSVAALNMLLEVGIPFT